MEVFSIATDFFEAFSDKPDYAYCKGCYKKGVIYCSNLVRRYEIKSMLNQNDGLRMMEGMDFADNLDWDLYANNVDEFTKRIVIFANNWACTIQKNALLEVTDDRKILIDAALVAGSLNLPKSAIHEAIILLKKYWKYSYMFINYDVY
jgi:hypothetical protein